MSWRDEFTDLLLKEGYITEDEKICLMNNNEATVDGRELRIASGPDYYLYVDDDFCIKFDCRRGKWEVYDI